MEIEMTRISLLARALAGASLICFYSSGSSAHSPATIDTVTIEKATGLKGDFNKNENVFKITKPRTDVKIEVDGWKMPPFMGLGSWAAFTPGHDGEIIMMGDTVLFEDEVNPAMSTALDAGLEVTALHNHFFFDEPKVYFMHIGGMGEASKLAAGVKKVYNEISEIRAAHPKPERVFAEGKIGAPNTISGAPLEAVLGNGPSF
jgi:Domain of Unknown Function (DUF1259)